LLNKNWSKSAWIRWRRVQTNLAIWQLSRQVSAHTSFKKEIEKETPAPVAFFNASTRLVGVSQNAAFAMLAAMSLQLAGIPVVYFACHAGMRRCVLGTQVDNLAAAPPCKGCMRQSDWLFTHAPVIPANFQLDPVLETHLQNLNLAELSEFKYTDLPLGPLVLPSLRWILRRHHLQDDSPTRQLFRDYIISAASISQAFTHFLEQIQPQAVVVFNGMSFPEAVAHWIARQRGLRVITHEVGLQPFTAFFTYGQATAYPLDIPDDFQLSDRQNARLDAYLEKRFKGQFSMAGVKFWKAISNLDEAFLQQIKSYRQLVAVFTNVIFDTSQPHSNTVFEHMFVWLDLVLDIASQNTDTLFVIRAHPDENRLWKESRQSVAQWAQERQIDRLPNIVFIDASQPFSSYELIQRAKFVMIYNSTIGLEASIMGAPVLSAGRARFTQIPTVYFPASIPEFRQTVEEFLTADQVTPQPEHPRNARRFLYYQLFRSSLPFGQFLEEDGIWPGFVHLKQLSWHDLTPEHWLTGQVILDGIEKNQEFLLPESVDDGVPELVS
jgi:hypothetical protein